MIIGIAGNINSGKDTVASMLNYIFVVGKNRAKFSDWMIKQQAYNNSFKHRTIHFADIIKLNLSYIFSLDVDVFNNRKFKDELWYIPSTGKFIEDNETQEYHKIELENYLELDISNPKHIIKLRTLIQMYAEHCKTLFGHRIWIKSTIIQACNIVKYHKYCLIPDVRFLDECYAIQRKNGIIIYLTRPNNGIESNHISENNNLTYNYHIDNNSNLSNLFYKVLAIYDTIKN